MYEHRLIFLYHYGYLPKLVDHINGDPFDNRIENLREATASENGGNRRKINDSLTSKYKGVSLNKTGKWRAQIVLNYRKLYLGLFDTQIEAAKAYNKAALELFGEFAKVNEIPDDKHI